MLVIGDKPEFRDSVRTAARTIEGLTPAFLSKVEAAHSFEYWDRVSVVLIHVNRSGDDAEVIRLLGTIAGEKRPVATLIVADQLETEQRLTMLRLGVADYLIRPLDRSRLSQLVGVLLMRGRGTPNSSTNDVLRSSIISTRPSPLDLEGDDERVMEQVSRVATQDTTILLGGETGTGKTRLARLIHELSNRRDEPFVVVNCGSMTAGQIEAELFGHVRGSLDGPKHVRLGKLAEVGRGTLFLDEVDALPLSLQPRLLKVVEDRVSESFEDASNGPVPIQARVIAATNRDLEHEVEAGRFRSDLYYRLNVIGLQLPPLRERPASIAPLASKFLKASGGAESEVDSISAPALKALEDYDWPGNIRELKNTIERAVALAVAREIQLDDLPEAIRRRDHATWRRGLLRPTAPPATAGSNSTLAEIKRDAEFTRITEALEKHGNNRLRAASELGISRMTLYKKLYKYGLMDQGHADRNARS